MCFIKRVHALLRPEVSGPLVLLAFSLGGLVAANTPLQSFYMALHHSLGVVKLPFGGGDVSLPSVAECVEIGPMTVFFLLITLELKKELAFGQLSTMRQCMLPLFSALGGVLVPAIIYMLIVGKDADLRQGWAIPVATDAAFTVPILLALGRFVSEGGRIWLMALAIFDDVLGILIIILFYGASLNFIPLLGVFILGAGLVTLAWCGVSALWIYGIGGVLLWGGMLMSGVHPILAGVIVGLCVPTAPRNRGCRGLALSDRVSPLECLEGVLAPWVRWCILPLFGFVSVGVSLRGLTFHQLCWPLILAVSVGLVVGKSTGIFAATWICVRCNLATLPAGTSWRMLFGLALICGVGFTVSLFMASLAFPASALLLSAKLGILLGSCFAALMGWWWLRYVY